VPATAPNLSATGLYAADGASLSDGVLRYTPQYPLWSDGLNKARFVRIPAGTRIDTRVMDRWVFPTGTQLWKEFSIARSDGTPTKVETRYMEKLPDGRWAYATYLWNADATDAVRAPDQGRRNHADLGGGVRHDIPSFGNCTFCHMNGDDPVLGFSALQLSEVRDPLAPHAEEPVTGAVTLGELNARGYFTEPVPTRTVIAARSDLERAALGYLHGNCASCHNERGRANEYSVFFPVELARNSSDAHAALASVNKPTQAHNFEPPPGGAAGRDGSGSAEPPRAIAPGDPDASVLVMRMKLVGHRARMPKVGSKVVDEVGVRLVTDWIASLSP
jgi:mono/diheme cytochrome c family protein